jgi:hypothetical protein
MNELELVAVEVAAKLQLHDQEFCTVQHPFESEQQYFLGSSHREPSSVQFLASFE